MEITEECVHVNGHPKRLVIFLHGYIDTAFSLEDRLTPLFEKLNDTAFHMPQAPLPCEVHEKKRQWYSMHDFDPNDDRKTVATMKECISIYERMQTGVINAGEYLQRYIDNCVMQYGFGYDQVFLCGFSQGATMAMYLALMQEGKIGGCVEFNGIIAPEKYLEKYHKTSPDILLIHGTSDNLVRFEAEKYTDDVLQSFGCKTQKLVIEEGIHRITDRGLEEAIKFIKERS